MKQLALVLLLALALTGCSSGGGGSLAPCQAVPQTVTAPPALVASQSG
jgi:PBP1b-binding outer membrane lipoprotein LpoB